MQRVLGFGGFSFRAQDPDKLAAWYHDMLGVLKTPTDYDQPCWEQERGPAVFAPFPADTDHFRDPAKSFMLNFRVADLDAMVKQLEAAGVAVEVNPETYPNGRFARFNDPEGNPVEIWQPEGVAAPSPASDA